MRMSAEGLALLKSAEALRLTAYTCPAGVLTIGYGHTGPDVYEGETIAPEEAESILRRDVGRFESCVADACPESSAPQFSAMASLAFNIGEAAFRKSSVARLHNARKYAEAGQAFALWNKAGGRVLPGLVKRRAAESALYFSDLPDTACDPTPTAQGEKPLATSRAVSGQAVALAGTAGTAAIGAVNDNAGSLSDWREWVGWLLPYAAEVKWLLIALIVGGIGYAAYARFHDRYTGRA